MKTAFVRLSVLLALAPVWAGAAENPVLPKELKKGQYNSLQYTTAAGDLMYYYLYLPANFTPTSNLPILAEVHGAGPQVPKPGGGGSAKRYLGLNPGYSEEKYPCIFFEPLVNPEWKVSCWDGRGWKTGPHTHDLAAPPKGIAAILELLPKLIRELGCDTNRCYVTGASNGGYATWDLITYRPDLFAAAIPICGAGDTGKVARIVNIPIWAFHGTADPTVPFKGTTTMIEGLEAIGGKPKHTYFEGTGHKTWDPAWKTSELAAWLFSQSKTNRQSTVSPK